MSSRRRYEILEQQALALDESDEELAERIRGVMDFLWFKRLSPDDKKYLNSRGTMSVSEPAMVVERVSLYVQVETQAVSYEIKQPVIDPNPSNMMVH